MDNGKQLYYKQGKRYYPYSKIKDTPGQFFFLEKWEDGTEEYIPLNKDTMDWLTWRGRPKEGIWKIERNSHYYIGDYNISTFRIQIEKYRDQLINAIDQAMKNVDGKYISRNELVTEILNEFDKEVNGV